MRRSRGLALALLLAGCSAGGLPPGPAVVVPGARFDGVRGESELVVRAHVEDAAGRREIAGARCAVTTGLFETEVVTPARLVVPNFGPQSPTLRIACRAGALEGSAEQRILTRWRDAPGARGPYPGYVGIAVGGHWGGGLWGWSGPSFPEFVYPDVSVPLA
jgi:hypothetical protein